MIFDKQWFLKHQKPLLFFSNSFVGRWVLCLKTSSVGKKKILKIEPNSITWKEGKYFKTEFRTHDKYAKRLFYAFKPLWYLFHIWDFIWYPKFNLGFDTLPDLFSDTGGDGGARAYDTTSFTTARSAATANDVYAASATEYACRTLWSAEPNKYLYRGFFPFDISSIPASATVLQSGTKFSVYVNASGTGSGNGFTCGLIQTTQASATALVAGDYDNITLNTPDEGATRLDIATATTGAYNDFNANANLVTWINAGSPLKLGTRISADIDNDFTAITSGEDDALNVAYADQAGTSNDPKLVVTYTLPGGIYTII